jgi:Ca2+-binding EF-hand superfamily protein
MDGSSGGNFDDNFNIDRQEYQSVFKVFDKANTGEINISQVYELINKFD